MRFMPIFIVVSAALMPLSARPPQVGTPSSNGAVQPLSDAIRGNWSGVLIFNDSRRNFTRVPARLRVTESVLYFDRDEIELPGLSFPSLRDWRADYEVIASALYLNPHRSGTYLPGPVIIGDITIVGNQLEGIVRSSIAQHPGDPFGIGAYPCALRMARQ